MWSGLLPPGIRESDNEDEEEEEEPVLITQCEDSSGKQVAQLSMSVDSGTCPLGVSMGMWHKFQELQKKNVEIKTQLNQHKQGRRRKRKRKDLPEGVATGESASQLSTSDVPLAELKQFFGINDRFEPPVTTKILQKSGLETSIDQALDRGDIEEAEELSDKLATREMGVKISKAVACRNFMKAKQEDIASQEARRKKKKLAWGFEAKQRWETKSNMGYM